MLNHSVIIAAFSLLSKFFGIITLRHVVQFIIDLRNNRKSRVKWHVRDYITIIRTRLGITRFDIGCSGLYPSCIRRSFLMLSNTPSQLKINELHYLTPQILCI